MPNVEGINKNMWMLYEIMLQTGEKKTKWDGQLLNMYQLKGTAVTRNDL